MNEQYIFFDVGANNGDSSVPIIRKNPDARVYAFEPVPALVNYIKQQTKDYPNYVVTQTAVSDFNGTASFRISGEPSKKEIQTFVDLDFHKFVEHNWHGCSSLLELSDNVLDSWYGRTDMLVLEEIEVNVIRLDSFIQQNNIDHIDFLWVDTQGSDLNVLKGLGDYIHIVNSGTVEAANKPDILYKNQNSKEETIEYLKQCGFNDIRVSTNDPADNEVNISFYRG
jgi:31-O-methyltransferase